MRSMLRNALKIVDVLNNNNIWLNNNVVRAAERLLYHNRSTLTLSPGLKN